jgi:SAM-dependent methyltransferase
MTVDYDKIARDYQLSKTIPFRECIEWHSYQQLLGDVSGLKILDLACGEGFYSRRVKLLGADAVVGVDVSAEMIELARRQETVLPLDIEYVVADVGQEEVFGVFDMVIASYLLNYARSREELLAFCRTIAANLKPGGRFVSINNNPDQPPQTYPGCRQYGFTKTLSGPLVEGSAISYEFFRGGRSFKIDNYYLSRSTHAWAFRQAGMTELRWHDIQVSSDCRQQNGIAFWKNFLNHAPIIGLESTRAAN